MPTKVSKKAPVQAPAIVGPSKFRSNLKAEQLAELVALKENDATWKVILKATGLSHSKAELAWMEHEAFVRSDPPFEVEPLTPEYVEHARNTLRIGWGPIMVRTQSSEGKVRKAWEASTNLHSDCKRVGHGGRFKFDDPELYVGELKPTGTDVPADAPLVREVARESAVSTRLMALDPTALKALYENYTGKKATRGWTKAKLVLELVKANDGKVLQQA